MKEGNYRNFSRAMEALRLREAGLTLAQVGSQMGVCRERARGLEAAANTFKRKLGTPAALLSRRTLNCLRASNIVTVGQAMATSDEELLRIPNFGKSCLAELRRISTGFAPETIIEPAIQ